MHRIAQAKGSGFSLAAALLLAAAAMIIGSSVQAQQPAQSGDVRVLGTGSPTDKPELQVLSQDGGGVRLEMTLPTLTVEDLDVDGTAYQLLAIPGGGDGGEVGSPLLPTFSRFVQVPDRSGVRVTVHVEDEEEVSGYRLIPVQSEDGTDFALNEEAYSRNDYGNTALAENGGPVLMRGLRVVPLTITPVRYNPAEGTLRIARRMTVEVSYVGEDLTNAGHGRPRSVTPSFDRLYRTLVANYEADGERYPVASGSYVVICANDAGVINRLQPLIQWRQRQGWPTVLATTAETGTTNSSIKAWLQNAYNTWPEPPEHVVLAGDASGSYSIPTWSYGGGEGDFAYSRLDGNDLIPDVHLGRLSFGSYTELEVIVAKTVGYESAPYMADTGWFRRACLVGDPSHSQISVIMVMQWVKTRLRQLGYAQVDTVFYPNYVSQMQTALNQGDTFFSYRGYWGFSGWNNSYTYALTNYNKLHFAVISTCGTGSFESGTSNSEAFLRAGSTTQPRAGIGAVGTATLSTHTRFNNCLTMGVFQGMLYEGMHTMGEGLTRGKYELYLNYGLHSPVDTERFCTWNNLMGDSACDIWTDVPAPMDVDYPSVMPVGANAAVITVTEEGMPCPDARVCLSKGAETYEVGMTDAQGVCELPVNLATAGTMLLTVTKHNRIPILANITVATADVFVGYQASGLDDDQAGASDGNGDGLLNPGEILELTVQLRNFGEQSATAVSATLSSDDPYVTVTQDQASYGDLGPGQSAWGSGPFVFSLDPACPHDRQIRFSLDASSGADQFHSLIVIPVVSARLSASSVTVYDAGNQRLDPGETREISVRLRNQGGANAVGVNGYLTSMSPWVSVTDASGSYGDILVNASVENTADRFEVAASADTYQGHLAVFRLVTIFNDGVSDTTWVMLTVGEASSDDPTGPDAHGYYAFDNTDTSYPDAPVYDWVEISQGAGGDGEQVVLGDYGDQQDKSRTVDLPFTFRYYGQEFDKATICSNGWIAMGETYLSNYRNWTIPGAGAAQNLLAVFWDELRETTSGGHVYQKYDAANHRWIVEWYRMINGYNSSIETFQAILYDPEFYPTITGDGPIVFQYQTVNNVDGTDGYATVGIENWDHTDGVLYTYFNQYPTTAPTLTTGRAIKFTSPSYNPAGVSNGATPARLELAGSLPNPFSGGTRVAFSLSRPGEAHLAVFDVQGRMVRRLLDGAAAAGPHQLFWDGRDEAGARVPSGLYFYRLEAEGKELSRRVLRLQ